MTRRLVSTAGADGMTPAGFVVGPGTYVALVGGLLLITAGAFVSRVAVRSTSRDEDLG